MSPEIKGWEQRWHPLRREWVIVAAHRQNRPWSGASASGGEADIPTYVPDCYLCPGNRRVSGAANPEYADVYVFDNDHPCVGPAAPPPEIPPHAAFDDAVTARPVDAEPLYRVRRATGVARVVCYSPRHDLSLSRLPVEGVDRLLRCWQEQTRELGDRPEVDHVLIFENRGEAVGVSNPHPHCQIYATNFVFKTIEQEAAYAAEHHARTGRSLLGDVIDAERADGRRLLASNDGAIAFVPHFARYAYEAYVAPTRIVPRLTDLAPEEVRALADVLRQTLVRYDNLWRMPFPYVMAVHQAPTDGRDHPGMGLHFEFHPPLRKPNLLKHLAGPEIGGGSFLSDTLPEAKAAELQAVDGESHYLDLDAAASP